MLSGEVGPPCSQSGYPRRTSKRQGWGRGPALSRVRGTTCLDGSCAVDRRDDSAVTSQTRSSGNLRLTQEGSWSRRTDGFQSNGGSSTSLIVAPRSSQIGDSRVAFAVRDWQLAALSPFTAGGWRLAGWKLETGNWKLATGNWELATGNWQLKPIDRRPSRFAKRAREGFR